MRRRKESNLRLWIFSPTRASISAITGYATSPYYCDPTGTRTRTRRLKVSLTKPIILWDLPCGPDGIRTHNTQFKRLVRSSSCATRPFRYVCLLCFRLICFIILIFNNLVSQEGLEPSPRPPLRVSCALPLSY